MPSARNDGTNGGAVSSGVDLESSVNGYFRVVAPGYDLYVPDHRGTGRSGRLGCEAAEASSSYTGVRNAPASVTSGRFFSITQEGT